MPADVANFYHTTRAARKVVVVDLGFLGDTVHLAPALWELARNYAQAELHVVTTPVGAEVLQMVPCVRRGWAVELAPAKRTLRAQLGMVRRLRRERFDVAFNFSGADRTVVMTALTGARWRVAHPGARWHFWNRWLIPWWVPQRPPLTPVFEQRRAILAACGLTLAPARFDLEVPAAARDWATAQLPAGAVHISINASTPFKEWPLARWIELGQQLLRERPGLRLLSTSSSHRRERQRLEAFAKALGASVQTFAGLPVACLAALLGRCALHVGADSGVLHLALAVGTPTVSLFRDYPALAEWAPRGPHHRCLTVPCRCLGRVQPDCRAQQTALCLETISAETVARAVNEELA